MRISLGNIIQILVLSGMGIVGWTTVQNRQSMYEQQQKDSQEAIRILAARVEATAELNAREAAIVDEMERRINRLEQTQDQRK